MNVDIDHGALSGALRRDSVKKNVAAIHVSGKLSLLQRKLSNVLLLNAYDELTTRQSHAIDAKTLCLMIGYNSNDTQTLKAALRSLAETVAEVNKTSNIEVTPEFRKQGRRVSHIRILIKENPQLAMFDIDDNAGTRTSETYQRLVGQGGASGAGFDPCC